MPNSLFPPVFPGWQTRIFSWNAKRRSWSHGRKSATSSRTPWWRITIPWKKLPQVISPFPLLTVPLFPLMFPIFSLTFPYFPLIFPHILVDFPPIFPWIYPPFPTDFPPYSHGFTPLSPWISPHIPLPFLPFPMDFLPHIPRIFPLSPWIFAPHSPGFSPFPHGFSPHIPRVFPLSPRLFRLFSRRERRCPAGRAVPAAGAEPRAQPGGSGHSAPAAAGAADAECQPRHQPPRGHPAHLHHHPGELPSPECCGKSLGKRRFPGKIPVSRSLFAAAFPVVPKSTWVCGMGVCTSLLGLIFLGDFLEFCGKSMENCSFLGKKNPIFQCFFNAGFPPGLWDGSWSPLSVWLNKTANLERFYFPGKSPCPQIPWKILGKSWFWAALGWFWVALGRFWG